LQIEANLMRRAVKRGEEVIDQVADEWPACRHH
jgi:hypothetical protein